MHENHPVRDLDQRPAIRPEEFQPKFTVEVFLFWILVALVLSLAFGAAGWLVYRLFQ